MEIALTPIIEVVAQIVAIGLGVLATWAAKRGADWLGIDVQEKQMAQLEDLVTQGVNFGLKRFKDAGYDTTQVDDTMVGTVSTYLINNAPKLMAQIGVDPNTPSGKERIREWIESRL